MTTGVASLCAVMRSCTSAFASRLGGRAALVAALLLVLAQAPQANAEIIFGPMDYNNLTDNSTTAVTTITDAQLNGSDELVIEYTVTRQATSNGNAAATLTFNDPNASFYDFVDNAEFAALTRTRTDTLGNPHTIFDGGVSDSSGQLDLLGGSNPLSHAVKITISGVSGGIGGSHSVTYEVDELATVFSSADVTLTDINVNFTAGSLALALKSDEAIHNVTNFTVSQLTSAVPEPSNTAIWSLVVLSTLGVCVHRLRRR